MERPKNYVPEPMEGKYSLNVKDNKIVVTKHFSEFDRRTMVRCSPEDEFDIGEGIKIAMQQLLEDDEISVGDTVKIVNPGLGSATMSYGFFKDVPLEYVVNFRYGVVPEKGEVGKVVQFLSNNAALVQVNFGHYAGNEEYNGLYCGKPVYCIYTNGLKKIKNGRIE